MSVLAYGKKDGFAATFSFQFILKSNNEIKAHRNTEVYFGGTQT